MRLLLIALLFGLSCHVVSSFASFGVIHQLKRQTHNHNSHYPTLLHESKKSGSKGGYKFGDITRSIGRKVTGNKDYQFGDITKGVGKKITGNEEYQFGDVSRWLDSKAKNAVNQATGKDTYEFGDLTKYLDERAKSKASEFTKKDEYVVGDISKEVVRRAWNGEYDFNDMILLLKVLAAFGFTTFSPVANVLPVKMLLEMYDVSLEVEVGGRLVRFLAEALDKRFKEALVGDANYQLGDVTKKKIMGFMGKNVEEGDTYEFGDFSKAVKEKLDTKEQQKQGSSSSSSDGGVIDVKHVVEPIMDIELAKDLDKFDKQWKKQNNIEEV
mmetsp:Transcript_31523/g.47040  ORF Transcript_31523/g.47040 Transcript_31523/m.47040 type:complete len:326 (-) Transcript_31523:19-996(-)